MKRSLRVVALAGLVGLACFAEGVAIADKCSGNSWLLALDGVFVPHELDRMGALEESLLRPAWGYFREPRSEENGDYHAELWLWGQPPSNPNGNDELHLYLVFERP